MRKIIMYSLSIIINLASIIGIIVLSIIFGMDHRYYQIYLGITIFLALFNVIMIMLMEILIKEYKSKRFSLFMHPTYAIISTTFYYVFKYYNKISLTKDDTDFKNYYRYKSIYVFIPILLTIIAIIVFEIMNYKIKEKPVKFDPKKYKENEYDPNDYLDKKYGLKEEDDTHRLFKRKTKRK